MAQAPRDENRVTTLLGVSNADGSTPVTVYADPTTHRLLVSSGGSLDDLSDVTITSPANGEVLKYNGSAWVNGTVTAGAAGSDTQVQFNDGGTALGGDAGFTYNKTTDTATLAGDLKADRLGMEDTNSSHYLYIEPGSDLTADRVLTITTGDAARTATLSGNLTIAADFITSGANSLTLTTSGATNVTLPTTGTLATLAGTETFTNKTLTSPKLNENVAVTSTATQVNYLAAATGTTGTTSTNVVFSTSPTLTTPVLGAATATSINGLTISATTGGTLTLANSSTLATSGGNSITLTSSGATNVTLPTTGTLSTLAGSEELTNKTLNASVGKGTWTASGTWTLPTLTLGGDVTFAENVGLVYDAALSADGKYCGFVRAGTAGDTLAFGDLVYLAAADSRWELADADAASTSGDVLLGMCVLAAAADGNATTILLQGFIRADAAFPALTISAPAYVSTTAGDIQTAQPSGVDDVIRRVGFAWTADELYFNPSNDYVTHT